MMSKYIARFNPVIALMTVIVFLLLLSTNVFALNFTEEIRLLRSLKVLPEKDWNPVKQVTTIEYITLLEKVINGQKKDKLINLSQELSVADVPITYQQALAIAGIFMGYSKEESFSIIQNITTELEKESSDHLSGSEMAYIFHRLLFFNRYGQSVNLLAERYEDVKIEVAETTDNDDESMNASLDASMIRILLSTALNQHDNNRSYGFNEIKVKASQPFKILVREDGKEQMILVAESDEVITFKNLNGKVQLYTKNYQKTVQDRVYLRAYSNQTTSFKPLVSTQELHDVPVFANRMEIVPIADSNQLNLINVLPIELYLRKTVPEQIPNSWNKEAFKVQAIAARTYVMTQIKRSRLLGKVADVDDRMILQIYQDSEENPLITQAIVATSGVVAHYQGQLIDAVYFSTSGGSTANNHEVWHNERTKEFPGVPIPYLQANSQLIGKDLVDMSDEQAVLAFYKNTDLASFDTASPYYRWKVGLSRNELENTINKNLPLREQADQRLQTDFIQTLAGLSLESGNSTFSIGKLKDIKVVQRGAGGNIMVLDIIGTNGSYRIMKEYNLRFLIRPNKQNTSSQEDILLTTHDGKTMKNYAILPSAFAAFEIIKDGTGEIEEIVIYGGGNGHGVGLSQWGVKGMVEQGYTYEEILKHYYPEIELEKVY